MIAEIQYLRALAALMVVLYHTVPQLQRMGYGGNTLPFLAYGVDIFFVISGFIMTYVSWNRHQMPHEFLMSRIRRIVPLYWVLTLAVASIGVVAPSVLQSHQVTLPHLVASLLFVPSVDPVSGGMSPLLQPGWTLNYEMYFYAIFAAFIWLPMPWRLIVTIGTLVLLTMAFALSAGSLQRFYADPIVLEFGFGIALGWLYCAAPLAFDLPGRGLAGLAFVLVGILALVVLGILAPYEKRLLYAGLPSLIIVAGALVASKASSRLVVGWLEEIGDASYSLYLSHFLVMSAVGQVSRKIFGVQAGPVIYALFVVYATAICILVSIAVHRFIEMKLYNLTQHRQFRRRAAA